MDEIVVVVSVGAVLTMIAASALVYRRMLPPMASLGLSFAIAAIGAVTWLGFVFFAKPDLAMELIFPGAALAGFATFMATIVVRSCGLSFGSSAVFALAWSLLVFVPVAMISFTGIGPLGVRPIDQGGSLAINVAAGAAALGGLVATRSRTRRASGSPLPIGMATAGVVALALGWLGWLIGSELAVDELTPTILANGLAGAAGGVVGWLLVQRIRHQSTTLAAVAAGLVSGLVAVSAGSAMYAPAASFAAAVIASSAACLFTLSRVGHTGRQQWFIVGSHLIAGAIGLVALGLFADDFGFLFTGQYVVLRDQVVSCILVAAYSMGVSMALWCVLRRAFARTPVLQRS